MRVKSPAPLLATTVRLQALRRRLTADMWSQTDEPYLLLEVPDDELWTWAPGFETALDGFIDRVRNPYAVVERFEDMVVLQLQGHGFWAPIPFTHWPWSGECEIVVLAKGRLPPAARDRESAVDDLLMTAQALLSTAEIVAPDCLAGF